MYNELLRRKSDVFQFLCDQKNLFFYKAQEAEDLNNPDGAQALRDIANHIDSIKKRILADSL